MANKQELEIIVKKLKEEIRLLRKENLNSPTEKVVLPIDGVVIFMDNKEYFVCDAKLNNELNEIEIGKKTKIEFLHMATMEAKKRMAYLFNGIKN